ncbi:hypothetical protein LTR94_036759, partial [Friedmanniomyces endolithicus]
PMSRRPRRTIPSRPPGPCWMRGPRAPDRRRSSSSIPPPSTAAATGTRRSATAGPTPICGGWSCPTTPRRSLAPDR